jgi:hypothetical protein
VGGGGGGGGGGGARAGLGCPTRQWEAGVRLGQIDVGATTRRTGQYSSASMIVRTLVVTA